MMRRDVRDQGFKRGVSLGLIAERIRGLLFGIGPGLRLAKGCAFVDRYGHVYLSFADSDGVLYQNDAVASANPDLWPGLMKQGPRP